MYTNPDLKMHYQYLCLHMKIIVEDFTLKHLLLFEICTREVCERFVYKHSEAMEYLKISLLFKKFENFTSKELKSS